MTVVLMNSNLNLLQKQHYLKIVIWRYIIRFGVDLTHRDNFRYKLGNIIEDYPEITYVLKGWCKFI